MTFNPCVPNQRIGSNAIASVRIIERVGVLVQIEANCQLARYVADIFDTQLSVRRLGRNNLEGIEGDSENVLDTTCG